MMCDCQFDPGRSYYDKEFNFHCLSVYLRMVCDEGFCIVQSTAHIAFFLKLTIKMSPMFPVGIIMNQGYI